MLQPPIPCSLPNPNLAVAISCIDLVMGNFDCHNHASLGLELPTFCELRELPEPYEVGGGAGVNEAVGCGNGQDLAVLLEDGGDAAVGGEEVGVLGGSRNERVEGRGGWGGMEA